MSFFRMGRGIRILQKEKEDAAQPFVNFREIRRVAYIFLKKIITDLSKRCNRLLYIGDPDEARTHDLQRDRLAF